MISEVGKKQVLVNITERVENSIESPLDLHLGQVISRGDKMEFTIQKSVELGVTTITPLLSERCGVKLDENASRRRFSSGRKLRSALVSSVAVIPCQKSAQLWISKLGAQSPPRH